MLTQTENVGSGCVLPLLQSIAGGVVTGLLAFAVAYGADWRLPWLWALVAWLGRGRGLVLVYRGSLATVSLPATGKAHHDRAAASPKSPGECVQR